MSRPTTYKYSKEHEWIDTSSTPAVVGVTDFAVEQLGDIVHIDLPEVGKTFKAGDAFGTIESTKTVSDLYMPVGGKITAVNAAIKSSPEKLQSDAFKDGWLVKIEISQKSDLDNLMDEARYDAYIKE